MNKKDRLELRRMLEAASRWACGISPSEEEQKLLDKWRGRDYATPLLDQIDEMEKRCESNVYWDHDE